MRRRASRRAERSHFALWLDAIWCPDQEWRQIMAGCVGAESEQIVARWRSWSGHGDHVLWWVK